VQQERFPNRLRHIVGVEQMLDDILVEHEQGGVISHVLSFRGRSSPRHATLR
jgi:hypothetical protein